MLGHEPLPVSTAGELAAAEKTVEDAFSSELKAARTPKAKVALAEKMLDTAAGSEPAGKYALLKHARELAIAAGDPAVGIRAVQESVAQSALEKRQEAARWASEGHRQWNQASWRRPPANLRMRLAAAECYLRGLDGLEGSSEPPSRSAYGGLGWKVSPVDFTFDETVEGWTGDSDIVGPASRDGCLVGQITGGDPYVVRRASAFGGRLVQSLKSEWP